VLRIAFDLDGVLADMDGELARHADALFGAGAAREIDEPAVVSEDTQSAHDSVASASQSDATPSDASPADASSQDALPASESTDDNSAATASALPLNARQTHRLWNRVQAIENFWETLQELEPGAIARLAALAAERRWEIIFLTKRPHSAGATAQVQTQRWLESKGFALPSVFVVQGSRGRIADALALDFVVDDRPENCLDVVVDSKARAILICRADQQALPAAIGRLGVAVVKSVADCLDLLVQIDAPASRSGLMSRVKRAFGIKQPANA
jgi:phosphoglycolate phosphatase-like HAD superfamily hydrolase